MSVLHTHTHARERAILFYFSQSVSCLFPSSLAAWEPITPNLTSPNSLQIDLSFFSPRIVLSFYYIIQNCVCWIFICIHCPSTWLTAEEAIVWLWVRSCPSQVDFRLLAWETSESACEWLFVRYSVYIHWFTSGLCPVFVVLRPLNKWLQELSWEQIFCKMFLTTLL